MNEAALFATGFVLFIGTASATLLFGYGRFNELYRLDGRVNQAEAPTRDGKDVPVVAP